MLSKVYPRIKVREQKDLTIKEEEEISFVGKVIETLSIEVQPSLRTPAANNGTESENDPTLWHAKYHKSLPKSLPASSISTSKGKNAKINNEDNMSNKRASSAPRPRAVLSSPDNDDLIGKQNRVIKRQTLPKMQSIRQSIQPHGKVSHKNAGVGPLLHKKDVPKESGNNSHVKERKVASEVVTERECVCEKRIMNHIK